MHPFAQGVYNSIMFALVLLISHFMVKNSIEGWASAPNTDSVHLEMQGGDVDAVVLATNEREMRQRRAQEQKMMMFAYVHDNDDGAAPVASTMRPDVQMIPQLPPPPPISSTSPASAAASGKMTLGMHPSYSTYMPMGEDEPVMNGGSLGLGAVSGYDSITARGTPLL